MRQKYILTQDGPGGDLHIQEYAVVDKDLKNIGNELLHDEHFDFIAEAHYTGEAIQHSISQGPSKVVDTLRTPNFFPIAPYANKLAETVMALYDDPQEEPLVLFFDDVDLMAFEEETDEEKAVEEA